jgi:hypothetical protein
VQAHISDLIASNLGSPNSPACCVLDTRPTLRSTPRFLLDPDDIDQIDPALLNLMPTRTDHSSFLTHCDCAYADRKRAA